VNTAHQTKGKKFGWLLRSKDLAGFVVLGYAMFAIGSNCTAHQSERPARLQSWSPSIGKFE
jgi:hypothetical protein